MNVYQKDAIFLMIVMIVLIVTIPLNGDRTIALIEAVLIFYGIAFVVIFRRLLKKVEE